MPPYANGGAPGYAAPPRANLPTVPPGGMGPPGGFVPMPREGWDRSGVSRGLAWFVGQLPNARSFDGEHLLSGGAVKVELTTQDLFLDQMI